MWHVHCWNISHMTCKWSFTFKVFKLKRGKGNGRAANHNAIAWVAGAWKKYARKTGAQEWDTRGERELVSFERAFSLFHPLLPSAWKKERERGQTLVFGSLVGCLHCYKCCHCKIWKKIFRHPPLNAIFFLLTSCYKAIFFMTPSKPTSYNSGGTDKT